MNNVTLTANSNVTYVGTRREIPVSFPFNDGRTLETAFAAPVVVGMMFPSTARPICSNYD